MATELIKESEVFGTGVLYYVEGYNYDVEDSHYLYAHAFVWGEVLSLEQAIDKALEQKPLEQGVVVQEWRGQAIDIDTSAGKIVLDEERHNGTGS